VYHLSRDSVAHWYTVTRMRGAARFVSEDKSFTWKCWGTTRVFDRFLGPSFYAVQPVFLYGSDRALAWAFPGVGCSHLNRAWYVIINFPTCTFLRSPFLISWVLHAWGTTQTQPYSQPKIIGSRPCMVENPDSFRFTSFLACCQCPIKSETLAFNT
jgi:hypothetical protein